MVNWLVETLRGNPELAIFLALGAGYWLGAIKFGSFSLGSVTGTLLAGILVGQLGIEISPQVKSVFFMLFLFAVGYGVGPQFVRGVARDGVPQALFAVVICLLVLACVVIASVMPATSRLRRGTARWFADDLGLDRSRHRRDQRPRRIRRGQAGDAQPDPGGLRSDLHLGNGRYGMDPRDAGVRSCPVSTWRQSAAEKEMGAAGGRGCAVCGAGSGGHTDSRGPRPSARRSAKPRAR
jgi:hypothetical protein